MSSSDYIKKLLPAVFGAAVFLVTLAVFSGALNNDFVNWDDNIYVYENPVIQASELKDVWNIFAGMHHFNYWHPAAWLSFALDYQVYMLNPWGYHFTSIVIHAMTATVVFFLFITLVGAVRPACGMSWNLIIAAAFAALVYGLHPLRVEPAVWIAERKEVMSGFFYFAGLLAYLHYVFANSNRRRILFYSGTLLLFCLGLLSKPHVVTFPMILLLLDWYPLKRLGDPGKRWPVLLEKIPYFVLSLAFSVATMILQKGGAIKTLEEVTIGQRLWNAVWSLSFYVEKTLWPFPLIPFIPLEKSPSVVSVPFILSAILLLGISYFCVKLWRRKNPLYLAAWTYYLIAVFPAIGIVQVGGQAAGDRFSYSTTLSFYFLLGLGMLWILEKKGGSLFRIPFRRGIVACGIILLALLSFLTHRQTGVWKNGKTLWTYELQYFPERLPLAHNNLGDILHKQGNDKEAVLHFHEAIRLRPNFALAHINLGITLVAQKKIDEAIVQFHKAIRLQPNFAKAHNNLGIALVAQKKIDEAIVHYNKAISLRPSFAQAHSNLGIALVEENKIDEAIVHYDEAIRLRPNFAQAHSNLGGALSLAGKYEEAIIHYRKAIKFRPNFARAHSNLGIALVAQKKIGEAIFHINEAIRLQPNFAQAHSNLGIALVAQKKIDKAIVHYDKAIRLQPNFAKAHSNLGVALSLAGKYEEAAAHYRKAIKFRPNFANAYFNLGNTLAQQEKLQEAIINYETAIKIDPGFTQAHFTLKRVRFLVRKPEEAANLFNAASEPTIN